MENPVTKDAEVKDTEPSLIEKEMQHVQELMEKSVSGNYASRAAELWMDTEQMEDLLLLFTIEEIPESTTSILMQYMEQILERDRLHGLKIFAKYLDSLVANPQYAALKNYHQTLSMAAMGVYESDEYQDYLVLYEDFQNDNSPEALAAKEAMGKIQEKFKKLA